MLPPTPLAHAAPLPLQRREASWPGEEETFDTSDPGVETLPPAPTDRDAAGMGRLALTILGHPDASRVGAFATFPGDIEFFSISRLEPTFLQLEGDWLPLGHASVSRQPLRVVPRPETLRISRHDSGSLLVVDGAPVPTELEVERSRLNPGIVIQVGQQVTLLLHNRPPAGEAIGAHMGMVGVSQAMGRLREQLRRGAVHDVSVLLQGESGTGKELAARALHDLSRRKARRFVAVNMATISQSMMAAQLFGYLRGAFTGAAGEHAGYFMQADQGTLFLDEMGEVGPEVQAALLRALESREIQRVGEERPRKVDVRIIAASDKNLMTEVVAGRLRNPLFHRLAGYWIHLPPLRERLEDLPLLLGHFVADQLREAAGGDVLIRRDQPLFPPAIWPILMRHSWPGNIRELLNLARSLCIDGLDRPAAEILRSTRELLTQMQAPAPREEVGLHEERPARRGPISGGFSAPASGEVVSPEVMLSALRESRWVVKTAALRLGCSRQTIYRQIRSGELGLELLEDIPSERISAAMAEAESLEDLAIRVLKVSAEQLRRRITSEEALQRQYRETLRGR